MRKNVFHQKQFIYLWKNRNEKFLKYFFNYIHLVSLLIFLQKLYKQVVAVSFVQHVLSGGGGAAHTSSTFLYIPALEIELQSIYKLPFNNNNNNNRQSRDPYKMCLADGHKTCRARRRRHQPHKATRHSNYIARFGTTVK